MGLFFMEERYLMKKDIKNVKRAMVTQRMAQSTERSKEIEENQVVNPDVVQDNYSALYSKGMTHNSSTLITDESKIKELQIAISTGEQDDFDDLDKAGARKQVSPQAALSFENMGGDPDGFTMPAPPALASRQAAAEMVEVYEKNILRDMTFSELNEGGANVDADRAVANLNLFGSDFKGPKIGGVVTRKVLFRGLGPKEDVGPYVSQLLLHPVVFGAHTITQKYVQRTGQYGITEANFLAIQNGNIPVAQTLGDTRYCSTPRDLGSIAHVDFVYQQFLYASLILMGRARQSGFPTLAKEDRFVTNGGPVDLGCAVTEIARHALKAAWAQKWIKHLRLRPEAMAARAVKEIEGVLPSGTVHADLLSSSTIDAVKAYNVSKGGENKAWLPFQVAEGSPLHPSYPAGHAAIGGACATIIKLYIADAAWSTTGLGVKESLDGVNLTDYTGADASQMTIHGELNKIASNIAIARNMLGVHYRSDGDEGVKLGEKVAIQWFKDLREQQNEVIGPISIVKFDGTTEIV
jgi:hypothetical protein